jgi:hypothetical protein
MWMKMICHRGEVSVDYGGHVLRGYGSKGTGQMGVHLQGDKRQKVQSLGRADRNGGCHNHPEGDFNCPKSPLA